MSMDSPTAQRVHENAPASVATPRRACRRDGCERELSGRQRSYCSGACRAAAYDQQHPRIAAPGVEPVGGPPIQALIADLLADGRQRTAPEIAYEIRRDSATVARELRKLRVKHPRLCAVTPKGGHERARWFLTQQ